MSSFTSNSSGIISDSLEEKCANYKAAYASVEKEIKPKVSRIANTNMDKVKNPATEIANGHLTFDIEFMPPTPAERITFESFINIELLKSLGGS